MDGNGPGVDWVMVPVPRSRVMEVMRLIATETDAVATQRGGKPAADEPSEPESSAATAWDETSLRDLVAGAPDKQVRVLEFLARRPDQPVPAQDLRDYLVETATLSAERSGRALGAVMKALGLRSKYYGGRDMPFKSEWTPELGNRYVMPSQNAGPVLEAVAERFRADGK